MNFKSFCIIISCFFVLFSCLCVVSADTGVDSISSSGVDTSVAVVVDSDSVSGGADVVGDCGVDDVVADSVEDNISSLESDLDEDNVGVDSDGSNVGSVSLLGASVNDGKNDVLNAVWENSFSALQAIIDNATPGSKILLNHSYKHDPNYDQWLIDGIIINKSLIIDGNSKKYTVDGNRTARCFNVSSTDVTFQNIIVRSGNRLETNKTGDYRYGGCFYFQKANNINLLNCTVTVTRLYFNSNYAAYGAGVFASNVNNFNVDNCIFNREYNNWLCIEAD